MTDILTIESSVHIKNTDVPFEATVTADGMFHATLDDQEVEALSLLELKRMIRQAIFASRYSVPFVHENGSRGVMRGYHAAQSVILVTWENGEKSNLSVNAKVFRPDVEQDVIDEIQLLTNRSIEQDVIDEIQLLTNRSIEISRRLNELRSAAVRADALFNEQLGLGVNGLQDIRREEVTA